MGHTHERFYSDQHGSSQLFVLGGGIYKAELEILCLLRMQVSGHFSYEYSA